MATNVSFITGANRGIGTESAEAVLVDGNQVVATGRKEAVKGQAFSDNFLPVGLDETPEDQVKLAALLPIITLVFMGKWLSPPWPAIPRSRNSIR
jgi:NAD(P)-dependent dehydrogenase (short-subunit alcohol dehydrogenase family)